MTMIQCFQRWGGIIALIFILVGNSLPCNLRAAETPVKSRTVLVVVAKSLDVQFDALARTIGQGAEKIAFWNEGRKELTQIFSADGPDFQRPFGVIVQTDGKKIWPVYFAPMKEHSNRLNNIVLFPQIYQPVRDEYGPTKRYRIRQDIPVLGAGHVFFWPFEPLFAEERNGWLMVTVADQFEYLPKDILASIDRSFRSPVSDDLLFARLEITAIPPDLAAGLMTLANVLLLEAPNAPFGKTEKETKDKLSDFLSACRQGLDDTLEITLSLEQDKSTDFLLTIRWRVKSETSTSKWFVTQKASTASLSDRIRQKAFPFPEEWDLLLPGKIRTISDALTLSTSEITGHSVQKDESADRYRQPLLSGAVHFTDQEATITVKLNSVFIQHIQTLMQAEEEQLQKEKQKANPPKKEEKFDIEF